MRLQRLTMVAVAVALGAALVSAQGAGQRSEEHTSELQSH